jgi:2-dehydro-3-deoxyphosphogluconate aldolase/(4S)-4-hydroxy-2-oxoglutarate aldolase
MSTPLQLTRVLKTGIVAILRADSGQQLADVASALAAGGVDIVEITFTVPQAHHVIEQVATRLGDQILLGAGTVLDAETARVALLSGAEFIVTPVVRPAVIQICRRYSKLVMPGAFTPTEVLTAWEAGADIVKIFPSDSVGPAHLKALRGPFPHIRLMPTGGITLDNAASFLQAGACAVGVGGQLASPTDIARGDLKAIENRARQFVQALQQARMADRA